MSVDHPKVLPAPSPFPPFLSVSLVTSLSSLYILHFFSLLSLHLSVLSSLSSLISNSWVEDPSNQYSTIRGNNDITLSGLAALFSIAAFTLSMGNFFKAILEKKREDYHHSNDDHHKQQHLSSSTAVTLSIPLPRTLSLLFSLICCFLSSSSCLAFTSSPTLSLTPIESDSLHYVYGCSYTFLRWTTLFSGVALTVMSLQEIGGAGIIVGIKYKIDEYQSYIDEVKKRGELFNSSSVSPPSPTLLSLRRLLSSSSSRYTHRYYLPFYSRYFLLSLLTTLTLMYFGSWLYSWMEGWNVRLSLLFTAVLLATIGNSDIVVSTPTAQIFTVFYFPIAAACTLFTLQLAWKFVLGGMLLIRGGEGEKESNGRKGNSPFVSSSFLLFRPFLLLSRWFQSSNSHFHLLISLLFSIWWTFIGALFFTLCEGWSYSTSLWFSFETLTTIGIGNEFPSSPQSSLFLIFFIIVGFGSFATILSSTQKIFSDRLRRETMEREKQKREMEIRRNKHTKGNGENDNGMGRGNEKISASHLLSQWDFLTSEIEKVLPIEHLQTFLSHADSYHRIIESGSQEGKEKKETDLQLPHEIERDRDISVIKMNINSFLGECDDPEVKERTENKNVLSLQTDHISRISQPHPSHSAMDLTKINCSSSATPLSVPSNLSSASSSSSSPLSSASPAVSVSLTSSVSDAKNYLQFYGDGENHENPMETENGEEECDGDWVIQRGNGEDDEDDDADGKEEYDHSIVDDEMSQDEELGNGDQDQGDVDPEDVLLTTDSQKWEGEGRKKELTR